MKENDFITIKIKSSVKLLLDQQKGTASYSEYLYDTSLYFEENGINPSLRKNKKSGIELLQGIEQLKKMIRAIERDKIDLLCEKLTGISPNKSTNSGDYDNLLHSYNTLKRDNEKLVEEIKRIKVSGKVDNSLTKEQLLKAKKEGAEELNYIINYYFKEENADVYFARAEKGKGNYFISRNFMDKFIEKAKTIIENMK